VFPKDYQIIIFLPNIQYEWKPWFNLSYGWISSTKQWKHHLWIQIGFCTL